MFCGNMFHVTSNRCIWQESASQLGYWISILCPVFNMHVITWKEFYHLFNVLENNTTITVLWKFSETTYPILYAPSVNPTLPRTRDTNTPPIISHSTCVTELLLGWYCTTAPARNAVCFRVSTCTTLLSIFSFLWGLFIFLFFLSKGFTKWATQPVKYKIINGVYSLSNTSILWATFLWALTLVYIERE